MILHRFTVTLLRSSGLTLVLRLVPDLPTFYLYCTPVTWIITTLPQFVRPILPSLDRRIPTWFSSKTATLTAPCLRCGTALPHKRLPLRVRCRPDPHPPTRFFPSYFCVHTPRPAPRSFADHRPATAAPLPLPVRFATHTTAPAYMLPASCFVDRFAALPALPHALRAHTQPITRLPPGCYLRTTQASLIGSSACVCMPSAGHLLDSGTITDRCQRFLLPLRR